MRKKGVVLGICAVLFLGFSGAAMADTHDDQIAEITDQLKEIKQQVHQAKTDFIDSRNRVTAGLREEVEAIDTSSPEQRQQIKQLRENAMNEMQELRKQMTERIRDLQAERKELNEQLKQLRQALKDEKQMRNRTPRGIETKKKSGRQHVDKRGSVWN
ncbi:MAG TPA: hypothetical protein ENN78_02695 [Candidatus Omnitrophica bacterium]|nr:hypothetical protein [Candidatus Omnitrophota bacterium]